MISFSNEAANNKSRTNDTAQENDRNSEIPIEKSNEPITSSLSKIINFSFIYYNDQSLHKHGLFYLVF